MAASHGSPDHPVPGAAAAPSPPAMSSQSSSSKSSSLSSTTVTTPQQRVVSTSSDAELLRSLNNLSLADTTPTPSHRSRAPSVASSRAPSRASSRASTPSTFGALPTLAKLRTSPNSHLTGSPRSPALRAVSNPHAPSPSRSATPTLLRKASMNSLHSASGLTISAPAHRDYTRRPSSSLLTPTALRRTGSPASPDPERKLIPTENSVARDFFRADLKANHSPESTRTSESVVLLHKDVYGHRWERPNTTKATLSTIVERPERIKAVTLGISLAYVQNGGRHQAAKHQIHPDLDPAGLQIPFQICQTEKTLPLSSPAVANVHGAEWVKELEAMCEDAGAQLEKGSLETKPLKTKRLGNGNEFHEGDLYLNRESLKALEAALGATVEAVDRVCSPDSPTRRAFVAVRPPGHHCSSDWPSGFCWVNNVHVGIMHGLMNHDLTHAAIIDFDLHHGDGSQALTVDHNARRHKAKPQSAHWKKGAIGYFSIHDINSYPCESGDWDKVKNASLCIENAHSQNIWNVHLGEWSNDLEFWFLYRTKYMMLLEKVRAFLRREADRALANGQEPKAVIFLSAGFDASEYEMSGMQRHGVSVPTDFYARWTRDVVKLSVEEGLAVDGRVISCLEGGYSDRALFSGTFAHLSGLVGNEIRAKSDTSSNGTHSRRSTLSSSDSEARFRNSGFPYDAAWWSPSELDILEAAKAAPVAAPRYVRTGATPTYCSPTQASNARVSDYAKLRRSMSGAPLTPDPQVSGYERSLTHVTPPPPVYWPTAVLELSKLLIPTDRPTVSISWDEIKEQDKRIKQEKNAASSAAVEAAAPYTNGVRKSTRERKPAQHFVPSDDSAGKSRRKTLGGLTDLASEKAAARGMPGHSRTSSRRLSNVSMAMSEAPPMPMPMVPPFPPSFSADFDAIRPESSLSVRTAPVRPPTRKDRPAATRRESINPGNASAPKKAAKSTAAKSQTASKAKSQVSSPARELKKKDAGPVSFAGKDANKTSTTPPLPDEDMSKITNNVKKIKISVVTKEMKEARARAQKEKDAAKGAENSETATVPQFASSAAPLAELEIPSSQQPPASKNRHSMDSVPPTPPDSGIFINYPPEGPAPQATTTSATAKRPSPKKVAIPAAFQGQGHKFTPTSAIPFSETPVKEATWKETSEAASTTPTTTPRSNKTEIKEEREIPETPENRF